MCDNGTGYLDSIIWTGTGLVRREGKVFIIINTANLHMCLYSSGQMGLDRVG